MACHLHFRLCWWFLWRDPSFKQTTLQMHRLLRHAWPAKHSSSRGATGLVSGDSTTTSPPSWRTHRIVLTTSFVPQNSFAVSKEESPQFMFTSHLLPKLFLQRKKNLLFQLWLQGRRATILVGITKIQKRKNRALTCSSAAFLLSCMYS